nr:phospholipase D-like domain-containing protein [uncultured Albidiferax sp.]
MSDSPENSPLDAYRKWLDALAMRDPPLYEMLKARMQQRTGELRAPSNMLESEECLNLESPDEGRVEQMALETIVREGRPALLVQREAIMFAGAEADSSAKPITDRLREAVDVIQPLLPLVGRIDSANYPGNVPYLGTGWLVDKNIVVTNRHVAELMARADGHQFDFKLGRFGEQMQVSIDYRREYDVQAAAVAKVKRVIWIEPDAKKADIAFIEVETADDNRQRGHFKLAQEDAADATPVAVIGYPARAPHSNIPDQTWMESIFGKTYDVKRVAPGLMGAASRGWATHDCTTLGGNSGSVVVNMKTGKAVALHFAGLYMVENYAVPASVIRSYLERRPWNGAPTPPPPPASPSQSEAAPLNGPTRPQEHTRTLSFNIPVRIDVTIGGIELRDTSVQLAVATPASSPMDAPSAADALGRTLEGEDAVLSVRPGALVASGLLTSTVGLVVAVHPSALERVRSKLPAEFRGFSVMLQPASIQDQLGMGTWDGTQREGVSSIAYNDADRTSKAYSFDWLSTEAVGVTAHVGPERSWTVLKSFIEGAKERLVSSMYEFHAGHIATELSSRLDHHVALKLVLARQSRNPSRGDIPVGDFDREAEFRLWRDKYPKSFENVYVATGSGGLVANSYHIKVTVRDDEDVWLSSGNWKRSSQPNIPAANLNDPRKTTSAGNREWHVTLRSNTLAERFRSHIVEDFRYCHDILGGTQEAIDDDILIDVPTIRFEAVELESAAERVFEPLFIPPRKMRVKPLLTPDKLGKVYTDAVLTLIESAQDQLLFQNQYISFAGVKKGNLKILVDALCKKSRVIRDCRIILRSGGDGLLDDMRALQLNGLDVNRCVKRLANTHTKGIVVDGKQVLIGSHNWSSDGVTLNRDASLIFDDAEIARYFLHVFEVDWERSSALNLDAVQPEAAPRLAVGKEPPDGFERMTLAEYRDR